MERIPRTRRKKTSIYIDAWLWTEFVKWCKGHLTSTCHILEPILYAILKGSDKLEALHPLPKIEMSLNVTREVARPRRAVHRGDQPLFEDWGTHLTCHVCGRSSRWVAYYSPGWDKTIRVYCCGYHVRRYRRMTSLETGYPRISMAPLYA